MNLTQRLAALEKGLITEPTILTMPGGRTVTILDGAPRLELNRD